MSRTVVTQEMVKEINELYLQIGTYTGVARKIGIAPTTVKKYIVPHYIAESTIQKKVFDKNKISKDIDFSPFINKEDWGSLCILSEQEKEEVKELWKELSM